MRILQAPTKRTATMSAQSVQFVANPPGIALCYSARTNILGRFDFATDKYSRINPFPGDRPLCFAFNPSGTLLALGFEDGTARVFRWPSKTLLFEMSVGDNCRSVAFSPTTANGREWVAAAGDEIQLRNITTSEVFAAFDPGQYWVLKFGPDGNTLFACDDAVGACICWTIRPFAEVFRVPVQPPLPKLAVTADGQHIAIGADGLRILALDGEVTQTLDAGEHFADLAFTPDGRWLLVADWKPRVRMFDTQSGTAKEFDFGIDLVYSVAVSSDGLLAAAGGHTGKVAVWDLDG